MALTRWFRKHRRYLLAGVVVMLMVSWGILGPLARRLSTSRGAVSSIRGEPVNETDLREASYTLKMAHVLGMADGRTMALLQFTGATPRATIMLNVLAQALGDFVLEQKRRIEGESAWRFLVLLREAEAGGVEVTTLEAHEMVRFLPALVDRNGFSPQRYQAFLRSYGYTDAEVSRRAGELAKVAKLICLGRESTGSTNAEIWMAYSHSRARARVRFIEIDSHLFLPIVDATQEELEAFYAQHREVLPDPASGRVGYMAPERAKVEYALASVAELMQKVEVSDDDVAAYYDANKHEFLETEASGEEKTEAETEGEAPGGEPAEEETSAAPRYKELDEVRETIRERLARPKATEKARELARRVLDELKSVEEQYANEPLPLQQMARRHGLHYDVASAASGRELLSREELEELVPEGKQVADFAFGESLNLYYPRFFDSADQPVVCQVLKQRGPEPQTLEEVQEQVRSDCLRQKALERAVTFAGKLKDEVSETGFEKAAETMNRRLADLLGLETERDEDADAAAPGPLTVRESDFFSRTAAEVPGMEQPVPALVAKAFELAHDQVAVAAEGPPVSRCYVVQPIERQGAPREEFAETGVVFRAFYLADKQNRAVREWMEGLLNAAQGFKEVTR